MLFNHLYSSGVKQRDYTSEGALKQSNINTSIKVKSLNNSDI